MYLILDLYSRKIVGWEVHDTDDSAHATHLVKRTALREGIATLDTEPGGAVTLNPEKESVIKMAEMTHDLKQVAA